MLLVVDGNNLAWAGFHALRRQMDTETPDRKDRVALLGLTQSVLGLVARGAVPPPDSSRPTQWEAAPISRVAVVFDEGRPLRRRSIYPAYQTGRESDPSFMQYEPHVLNGIAGFTEFALAALPVSVYRGVNTEADDLVAALVMQEPGEVRIASTDRDFLQLVDERVSVYSPVKRVVVTPENFAAETAPKSSDGSRSEFPRERYLEYRAASGDSSDDLPGIPGVGTISAARLVAKAPLADYLGQWNPLLLREALGRKVKAVEEAFANGVASEVIDRNKSLMDLRLAALNYPDLAEYRNAGKWDEAGARDYLAELRAGNVDIEGAIRGFRNVEV
jgi:5'-3' exonuclease